MKTILAATDFSTRSDRAIRRAEILARTLGMALALVHVVDDDRPAALVEAEMDAAGRMLGEQAAGLSAGGVADCAAHVMRGDPFDGVLHLAAEIDPALIVIGPHRRSLLKDMFVGTTAERMIRKSRWPVLMANAVPGKAYGHVLATTDFSEASRAALAAVAELGLAQSASVSIVHAYDAPAVALMVRTTTTRDEINRHIEEEKTRAASALAAFLAASPLTVTQRILRFSDAPAASAIRAAAQEIAADLIVTGRSGRSGMARAVLGSVTQALLQADEIDILVVPSRERPDAETDHANQSPGV